MKQFRASLTTLEAAVMGLFFVQALRYLIGAFYARVSSVSLASVYPADSIPSGTAGVVDLSVFTNEIALLGFFVALPVLTILVGRIRWMFIMAVLLAATGRALMNNEVDPVTPIIAAEMVVSGGLIYISLLSNQRARILPYFFIFGLVADQLMRAYGNTLDPSIFDPNYGIVQIILSVVVVVLSMGNAVMGSVRVEGRTRDDVTVDLNKGILTFWSAIGLGGLLFLQLSLLSLPNAIAGRADADYTLFVPAVIVATLLPIVPEIRAQARRFITPFDATTRGWIWLILLALLIVIGTRIGTITVSNVLLPIGGITLVVAQFFASMVWWWFARPRTDGERHVGGLWLIFMMLVFALLVIFDIFTYEYAFVRDFAPPLDTLNPFVPPLLRGFRGLGLAVILLAAFLSVLPMIQTTRRVPWAGDGNWTVRIMSWLLVPLLAALGAYFAQPTPAFGVTNVPNLRVGTYNIHSGYSEFFDYTLQDIARTIDFSGAQVVLLQEVEAGRLTSFGVDQSLWLARRLGMDRRFYPTNEGLHGLAVLSRVPIVFDDGELLPSLDQQAGVQRVQIRPDDGAITIYNTSLGLLLQGDGLENQEANQQGQLNAIMNIIARHVQQDYGGQLGRALLGGTFHNVPTAPLYQIPQQYGFVDPFAGASLETSATINRINLRPARYDYLWLWSQSLRDNAHLVINQLPASERYVIPDDGTLMVDDGEFITPNTVLVQRADGSTITNDNTGTVRLDGDAVVIDYQEPANASDHLLVVVEVRIAAN